jgi:hypothetical protein
MQNVLDPPSAVAEAGDTLGSPIERPVIVTLVHGTVLFARWPRILGIIASLRRLSSHGPAEPAWYQLRSKFVTRLAASLGPGARIIHFSWSGGNSVWERIHAAGADADFGLAGRSRRSPSLREHVAQVAKDHRGAPQVLVAHSHGGNVCLYALRDSTTRSHVRGLVCLSTPFVHARRRADSGVLDDMLRALLGIAYLIVFFGASQWVSSRVPEPWDAVLFGSVFTVVVMAGAVWWGRRESRQRALRMWAESVAEPQPDGPPTRVLLADGDEALLALKIAEGFNVMSRGLWRVTYSLLEGMWSATARFRRSSWLYVALSIGALLLLLLTDAESPVIHADKTWSVIQVLKFLAVSALAPALLVLALGLVLATPAFVAMLLGYPALLFWRWLAFGWGGSIGVDITAETCPLGTAAITRLGRPVDASGLGHAHSYNDEHAPELIAEFVAETTGLQRPAAV